MARVARPAVHVRGLGLGGAAVSARVLLALLLALVISPGSSPPAVEGY